MSVCVTDGTTPPGFKCYYTFPSVREPEKADVVRVIRIFTAPRSSTTDPGVDVTKYGITFETFSPKVLIYVSLLVVISKFC